MSTEGRASVAVIGVGNAYLSDEGAASHVVDEVARRVPTGVEVIDAGLPGPGLLDLLRGRQKVVIVDAVDAGKSPGTVYRFHPEDAAPGRNSRSHSLHDGNVLLYVNVARALGMGLEQVVVVGVQPKDLSPGNKLSPPVEAAVEEAAERVLAEVRPRGREEDGGPRPGPGDRQEDRRRSRRHDKSEQPFGAGSDLYPEAAGREKRGGINRGEESGRGRNRWKRGRADCGDYSQETLS